MSTQQYLPDDLIDDDSYYDQRQATSAIPYNTTQGNVIPRGASYRVHQGYAPMPRRATQQQYALPQPVAQKRHHWLFYTGVFLFVCIVGWAGLTLLGNFWQQKQDDWQYGMPRTFQTDAVVGHFYCYNWRSLSVAALASGTHGLLSPLPPGGHASSFLQKL